MSREIFQRCKFVLCALEWASDRRREGVVASTRPRLSEVAARAGVSEKTVSNVINNYEHVSTATREKVERALTDLNYRVNLSARSLASGRTGFIALAVPGLDNPYFAELAGHVITAAAAHKWTVLIEQTGGQHDTESQVIGGIMPVDGIVLHPESLTSSELLDSATPVVLIGEKTLGHVADHVVADNVAAAYDLTRHLLDSGRRRIACIGLEEGSAFTTSALRFEGYEKALVEAGLSVDPTIVVSGEGYKRADGVKAINALLSLDERPDAIMCFNDVLAIGVLHGLTSSGIAVPNDIAVAGFDNIEETEYSAPPLTTIAWDTRTIAERAVDLLAQRQGGGEQPPLREISVGYELMVRGSTAL